MKNLFGSILPGLLTVVIILIMGCQEVKSSNDGKEKTMNNMQTNPDTTGKNLETAVFASGCFWCSEAVFERVQGVYDVVSGYAGGAVENPSYEEVCNGRTGHAEAIEIKFDPKEVSYDELLKIFWKTHDPTTLNKQGNDVGTQYRSAIFYKNDEQKMKAEGYKKELTKAGAWKDPIVTEIVPFTNFYVAEDYHQDYYAKNPNQGYCAFVIGPKIEKFEKVFKDKLKK